MKNPSIQIYANMQKEVYGVVLNHQNQIAADETVAQTIAKYKSTVADYASRNDVTWAMSLSMYRLIMEQHIGAVQVEGDSFLEMLQSKERMSRAVGNSACQMRIIMLDLEEIEPFMEQAVLLDSGKLCSTRVSHW